MKQKHVLPIFGIILVVVMVLLAMPSLLTEAFTKEKWDNATPNMRDRLMDGLARSGMLVGLSEEEVYEMLGDPDGSKHGRAMYYLRDEGQSGPCLILSFTRDGNVASESLSSMGDTTSHDAFDEETWQCGTPSKRLSMVQDLIASNRLRGLSRLEVYELLDTPDWETPGGPTIYYCGRYYDESGELKKRYAGISRCLYIELRDKYVEKAEFKGS